MADQFSRMYDVERVGGDQRQRLAEMLRANALNTPQGQMVSGWYVPPSWSQNLAHLAQTATGVLGGQYMEEQKNKQFADLLKKYGEGAPIQQEQPMQNINRIESMGEGQTQQEPQNELQRIIQSQRQIQSPDQSQITQARSPAQPQQYRPWTAQEKENMLMQAYEIDPRRAAALAARYDRDVSREEARALKEEERAWKTAEAEKQRQFLAGEHALTRAVTLAGRTPASEKPLTEFQGKSVTFGTRAAQAHNILNSLEDTTDPLAVVTNQKGGILTNWMMPANVQRVDQAQRDFINANLRQESGATIQPPEFENARRQYFPQPGDTPEVIAQKRMNRELVVKGFARQAGPGGVRDVLEVFNAGAPQIPSSTPQQTPAKQGRLGGLTPPNTQIKFLGFEPTPSK